MKLWQGVAYTDDRLFILDLQLARKGTESVWAVITRRNAEGFPPFRVDDFPTMEAAVAFIQQIEPETPRISLGGKSPTEPLPYMEYLMALQEEGVPSAMQIYEMNKRNRGELLIEEIQE